MNFIKVSCLIAQAQCLTIGETEKLYHVTKLSPNFVVLYCLLLQQT